MVACRAMSGFVFQWYGLLPLLILVLPLAWLLAHARRRRAELIAAMGGGLSTHRRLRDYLRLVAFALLLIGLARPGYAPQKHSMSQSGRDVVFALDVSQSMLAEDVSPSRLEVAKQAVRDALKTFSSQRVGLVVYAGSATIMCPLTYDYDFVRYMLEQTHTRSVDFGGTTVQSAVEKVVDQVFMSGRGGVQDLIILTDGGDHGSQMSRVVELLDEYAVDLLLVGLGNPDEGSPIPVLDAKGERSLLRTEEGIVYTRLDDTSLRTLAAQSSDAVYIPVGVRAFDLGQIYFDYAKDREVSSFSGDDGVVVYREAALFFIVPALLLLFLSECWGAKGLEFGLTTMLAGLLLFPIDTQAAELKARSQFSEASQLYVQGAFAEAEALFTEVVLSGTVTAMSVGELAAVQLNRGLCFLELSRAQGEELPNLGMSYAREAQFAFLAAKRYAPTMERAGLRLESTAAWVAELQLRIDEATAAQEAIEAQMQQLIERLQALLEAQKRLREQVLKNDVSRWQPKRRKDTPPDPITAPPDSAENALRFVEEEASLQVEGESIHLAMQKLDVQMTPPALAGLPLMESVLGKPLELMAKVPPGQLRAVELLAVWDTWPGARTEQWDAEKAIEEILSILSSNSSDSSDGDEGEEMDYDGEYEYSDEMDESMMGAMPMEGDFTVGGEMQALPLPNYSAEDILMEEQGNLQFRQQQRASANAADVEKDY